MKKHDIIMNDTRRMPAQQQRSFVNKRHAFIANSQCNTNIAS